MSGIHNYSSQLKHKVLFIQLLNIFIKKFKKTSKHALFVDLCTSMIITS